MGGMNQFSLGWVCDGGCKTHPEGTEPIFRTRSILILCEELAHLAEFLVAAVD